MNTDKNLRASKFMRFQKSKENILNSKYIKSFCTIGTTECWKETVLMIKTLRKLYDEPIIICGDEKVKSELKNHKIENYIFKDISLDGVDEPNWSIKAYHNNRALSLKYLPIKYALDQFENTMFIDSDFLILERFDEPYDGEISLCRHFRKNNGDLVFDDQFGKYNSGLIFCKDDYFPEWWRNQMLKDSYFTDQECLSRCLNFFAVNEMSKNNNVGFWRVYGDFLYDKSINKIKESLDIKIINGEIFIEGYKLNNFHVHMFMDDKLNLWQEFKNFVLYCLENSNNKWIIDEINKLK
jgi:hypothetical protein